MSKEKNTGALSAQELQTKKSAGYMVRKIADRDIDYSDIPKFTETQLRQFRPLSKAKQKLFKKIEVLVTGEKARRGRK